MRGGLGRDFLLLWLAQSVSVFGNQVTLVALPLTAVLALDAGASEMGLLRAIQTAPILLFSLAVGVWIQRGSADDPGPLGGASRSPSPALRLNDGAARSSEWQRYTAAKSFSSR